MSGLRRLLIAVVPLVPLAVVAAAAPASAAPRERVVPGIDVSGPDGAFGFPRGVNNRGQVLVYIRTLWQSGRHTDLGSLGGGYTRASAIDDAGVVGESTRADGTTRAFLWQRGRMLDLGTLGGATSSAYAISANGHVAGLAALPDGSEHVFHWRAGKMTDTGIPATFGATVHVNARGQIAAGQAGEKAYLWDRGRVTELGGTGVTVQDMNDRGEIVGIGVTDTGLRGFRWWRGRMTDLGTLGGFESWATDINNRGQIVGSSTTGSANRAFLWEDGVMRDLSAGAAESVQSSASRINERGDVVGNRWTADVGWRGVVWRHDGVLVLDALGGESSTGLFLNDHGLAAGLTTAGPFDPPRSTVWKTGRR